MGMHTFTPLICYYSSVFTPGRPPGGRARILPYATPYMGRKKIRVQSAMTQMESDGTSFILALSSGLDRVHTTHDAWHKIIHKRSS
jgi:hypothetical protein